MSSYQDSTNYGQSLTAYVNPPSAIDMDSLRESQEVLAQRTERDKVYRDILNPIGEAVGLKGAYGSKAGAKALRDKMKKYAGQKFKALGKHLKSKYKGNPDMDEEINNIGDDLSSGKNPQDILQGLINRTVKKGQTKITKDLGDLAEKGKAKIGDLVEQGKAKVGDLVEEGQAKVGDVIDKGKQALDDGKQALEDGKQAVQNVVDKANDLAPNEFAEDEDDDGGAEASKEAVGDEATPTEYGDFDDQLTIDDLRKGFQDHFSFGDGDVVDEVAPVEEEIAPAVEEGIDPVASTGSKLIEYGVGRGRRVLNSALDRIKASARNLTRGGQELNPVEQLAQFRQDGGVSESALEEYNRNSMNAMRRSAGLPEIEKPSSMGGGTGRGVSASSPNGPIEEEPIDLNDEVARLSKQYSTQTSDFIQNRPMASRTINPPSEKVNFGGPQSAPEPPAPAQVEPKPAQVEPPAQPEPVQVKADVPLDEAPKPIEIPDGPGIGEDVLGNLPDDLTVAQKVLNTGKAVETTLAGVDAVDQELDATPLSFLSLGGDALTLLLGAGLSIGSSFIKDPKAPVVKHINSAMSVASQFGES